jgi:hypothetical protein
MLSGCVWGNVTQSWAFYSLHQDVIAGWLDLGRLERSKHGPVMAVVMRAMRTKRVKSAGVKIPSL